METSSEPAAIIIASSFLSALLVAGLASSVHGVFRLWWWMDAKDVDGVKFRNPVMDWIMVKVGYVSSNNGWWRHSRRADRVRAWYLVTAFCYFVLLAPIITFIVYGFFTIISVAGILALLAVLYRKRRVKQKGL